MPASTGQGEQQEQSQRSTPPGISTSEHRLQQFYLFLELDKDDFRKKMCMDNQFKSPLKVKAFMRQRSPEEQSAQSSNIKPFKKSINQRSLSPRLEKLSAKQPQNNNIFRSKNTDPAAKQDQAAKPLPQRLAAQKRDKPLPASKEAYQGDPAQR